MDYNGNHSVEMVELIKLMFFFNLYDSASRSLARPSTVVFGNASVSNILLNASHYKQLEQRLFDGCLCDGVKSNKNFPKRLRMDFIPFRRYTSETRSSLLDANISSDKDAVFQEVKWYFQMINR